MKLVFKGLIAKIILEDDKVTITKKSRLTLKRTTVIPIKNITSISLSGWTVMGTTMDIEYTEAGKPRKIKMTGGLKRSDAELIRNHVMQKLSA